MSRKYDPTLNAAYYSLSIISDDLAEITHYQNCECYTCLSRPYNRKKLKASWESKSLKIVYICMHDTISTIISTLLISQRRGQRW